MYCVCMYVCNNKEKEDRNLREQGGSWWGWREEREKIIDLKSRLLFKKKVMLFWFWRHFNSVAQSDL